MRKISHLYPQITTRGVGVLIDTWHSLNTGHKNIAKKPVSRSCDSQPENLSNKFYSQPDLQNKELLPINDFHLNHKKHK